MMTATEIDANESIWKFRFGKKWYAFFRGLRFSLVGRSTPFEFWTYKYKTNVHHWKRGRGFGAFYLKERKINRDDRRIRAYHHFSLRRLISVKNICYASRRATCDGHAGIRWNMHNSIWNVRTRKWCVCVWHTAVYMVHSHLYGI